MQGAEVMVCGPKTLIPKYITELGVKYEPNLRKALEWCDVANMLRVQNERLDVNYFPSTREYAQQYGVDKDRKSTRLNSSHVRISYAVFCLKKKQKCTH